MSFSTIAQQTNQGLSTGRQYLDERANALLSPKTARGISGFVFQIPDTEEITLTSDVTDHFTENNSFINDHVVNKPIQVTLTGSIGELFFERPRGLAGAAQAIQNRLETVEAYLGDRTPGFVQDAQAIIGQAQTAISAINQTLDRVQNVVGLFEGEGPEETLQQLAYQELFALYRLRSIVTVQTPWTYYDSMIITSISFRQNVDSEEITDISVSLKEFRVAQIQTVAYDDDLFPPRSDLQETSAEDQGTIRGIERNSSFLFQLFGGGG